MARKLGQFHTAKRRNARSNLLGEIHLFLRPGNSTYQNLPRLRLHGNAMSGGALLQSLLDLIVKSANRYARHAINDSIACRSSWQG